MDIVALRNWMKGGSGGLVWALCPHWAVIEGSRTELALVPRKHPDQYRPSQEDQPIRPCTCTRPTVPMVSDQSVKVICLFQQSIILENNELNQLSTKKVI